jgi:hypothetical protein
MTNPLIGIAATATALFVVVYLMLNFVQPYLDSVTSAIGAVGR